MILIAHRGLMNGPNKALENLPSTIEEALDSGFEVEIDLQIQDSAPYLGHDFAQYPVDDKFLRQRGLWIHCKTINALKYCIEKHPYATYFYHEADSCVVTTNHYIWTFPRKEIPLTPRSIAVLPELYTTIDGIKKLNCAGVCSDYVGKLGLI